MTSGAERVAQPLLAFGDDGEPHGVSELARAVGRERSQVSRMLKALSVSGIVEQDPVTRAYRLGWNLRVLAGSAGDLPLVRASRPALQLLVAKTREVALLSVQQADSSLTVLREEPPYHSLRAGGWVGRRSPLHCTASGRALLFDADDELVEDMTATGLGARDLGPSAPGTLDEVLDRLRRERLRGYSVASEELEIGLTSVAVPVRDRDRRIRGVLNVSAPTPRIVQKTAAVAKLLARVAASVSASLG